MSFLVLDTSAIIAYATGSVDVGEPMAEVRDAGGVVLVPVVCLVEASRTVDERGNESFMGYSIRWGGRVRWPSGRERATVVRWDFDAGVAQDLPSSPVSAMSPAQCIEARPRLC